MAHQTPDESLGLRPRRAVFLPLLARSSTSEASTSTVTCPRRAIAITDGHELAASLSSLISLPDKSETKIVFLATIYLLVWDDSVPERMNGEKLRRLAGTEYTRMTLIFLGIVRLSWRSLSGCPSCRLSSRAG